MSERERGGKGVGEDYIRVLAGCKVEGVGSRGHKERESDCESVRVRARKSR